MRVTVQIDDQGELQASTLGYRGQGSAVVLPLLSVAVVSALQRLQQQRADVRLEVDEAMAQAGPAAVITSDVVIAGGVIAAALDESEPLPERELDALPARLAAVPDLDPAPLLAPVTELQTEPQLPPPSNAADLRAARRGDRLHRARAARVDASRDPALAEAEAEAVPPAPQTVDEPTPAVEVAPDPAVIAARAAAISGMQAKRYEALRMLATGALPEVIADELGVSTGQVRRWDRGDL